MFWVNKLSQIVSALFRTNGHRGSVQKSTPAQSVREGDVAYLREEDVLLTEHFSLFEMTATSNKKLQKENRTLTDAQVKKLTALANHAEVIREICGGPVVIHSGYRSLALNGATAGSSSTSQHPRCEAIDFHVKGQSEADTFAKLLDAGRKGKFKFGQLIFERAERSYGSVVWIHCSVVGSLDPKKIGQVLRMDAGSDGKAVYTLVTQLIFK